MMTLGELLNLPGLPVEVTGISADSRSTSVGDAFFAIAGSKDDGLKHVAQAVARGALAVIAERRPEDIGAAIFVPVSDTRAQLSHAASRFYPERPSTIVAITGTSGKTSVAAFVRQIWERLGLEAASLGTIGIMSRPITIYGSLTTPDPVTLHQTLTRLARAGVTHLAMEASSHGLDQKRLDGVTPAAAAFTNLSRDHMDYHATQEDYLAAKLRLFRDLLPPDAPAVIDADSEIAPRVIAAVGCPFTVGAAGAAIRLVEARREGFATWLKLVHAGAAYETLLPLPGGFQVSNALVAAGLCIATGCDTAGVFAALTKLEGAPGRLERIGDQVFVDYAHKPDALEKALAALRPFVSGRLIVVLGCGGDRDSGKRPMMGAIASRGADVVIVTDDNPRSENPAAIRAAILAQAPGAREIGDRAAAIREGVAMLRPGDALMIAGKGHETGQIVGDRTLAFCDADEARAALEIFQ